MTTKKKDYESAMRRLEEIVRQMENNELTIDHLTAHLKEAKELITYCQEKLYKVDEDVKRILENF
jgi:exodeoxyribonuclease VII small subunit